MHYTYILKLNDGNYYTGSTANIKDRLKKHQGGNCLATKHKRPLRLVWYGVFRTKKLAENFEKYLKSSSGFSFRNKRLV